MRKKDGKSLESPEIKRRRKGRAFFYWRRGGKKKNAIVRRGSLSSAHTSGKGKRGKL